MPREKQPDPEIKPIPPRPQKPDDDDNERIWPEVIEPPELEPHFEPPWFSALPDGGQYDV